jgi:hypothetical protein
MTLVYNFVLFFVFQSVSHVNAAYAVNINVSPVLQTQSVVLFQVHNYMAVKTRELK